MYEYAVVPGWWHSVVPLYYGYEICQPGHHYGPAVRNNYLLHYVLEGEGTFSKDGKTYEVHRGDLFVILPGEVTVYEASRENPWAYYWIGFQAEKTLDFLAEPVLRQPPVRQFFEQARDRNMRPGQDDWLFPLIFEVLWSLAKDAPAPKNRENRYAAYARAHLENSFMRDIRIQEIADALHVDRRYLTGLFRQAYGMSPQQYLMQLRLNQARKLLRQGFGVMETAAMAGFSDLSNFSRQYKRHFGVSPSGERNLDIGEDLDYTDTEVSFQEVRS